MLQEFIHAAFGIFGLCELVGDIDVPVWKMLVQCLDPFGDTSLARVDFLTAAHKAYDGGPVLALVKRPDEEGSLRHGEVGHLQFVAVSAAAFQIVGQALVRPRTLRLIEDGHVLHFSVTSLG